MVSYAIVEACGKQLWVEKGRFYDLDRLPFNPGDCFTLNNILLIKLENEVHIGKPFLNDNYQIKVQVLRNIAGSKIRVYKMRPKKKTRKTFGARSKLTRVLIKDISKKVLSDKKCYIK